MDLHRHTGGRLSGFRLGPRWRRLLAAEPVSDAALLHILREMRTDRSLRAASYSEFGAYLRGLKASTTADTWQYVLARAARSLPIYALSFGLLSCVLTLGQMYVWPAIGSISKLCASLSLASGVVPLYVFFALQHKAYRELEDAKLSLGALVRSSSAKRA